MGRLPLPTSFVIAWLCLSVSATNASEPPKPFSHYERRDGKDRVVVFVHGIFGDLKGTWTCPTGVSWPKLILADNAFKDSAYTLSGTKPVRETR